tara:strand:- start:25705 stop:25878 length:174 start_codon:yes stop_codon:yes gene_type:complete
MPWLTEILAFIGGVIATLTAKPLLGRFMIRMNSNRVNQSNAKASGDIVGRDKIGRDA